MVLNRKCHRLAAAILLAGLLPVSCGDRTGSVEITQTREVALLSKPAVVDATSAQRFGFQPVERPGVVESASAEAGQSDSGLSWSVPDGWRPAPAQPMREATYLIGPGDSVECYISVFGHAVGGLDANINRWRAQMGLDELAAEAIAALPTINVLGRPSPLAEVGGSYTDMTGRTVENALMLGVVCMCEESAVFVKMVGPADQVTAERGNFIAFCESLKHSEGVAQ